MIYSVYNSVLDREDFKQFFLHLKTESFQGGRDWYISYRNFEHYSSKSLSIKI